MQTIKLILNIINWITITCIVLLAAYFISPKISSVSGYQSFVVQSGSMEPFIMTGDIIISKLKSSNTPYQVDDVITYNSISDGDTKIVTHRVIETIKDNNQYSYKTKGDANRTEDGDQIKHEQVIGQVIATIPKIGYMVAFAKTMPGLILLLLLPTTLYIVDELMRARNARR